MNQKLIIFAIYLAIAFAQSKFSMSDLSDEDKAQLTQCVEETKVELKDLENLDKEVSEKAMCFFKCKIEKEGLLNEDFTLNREKAKSSFELLKMTDEEIKTANGCLDQVSAIKECKDMEPLMKCFPKRQM